MKQYILFIIMIVITTISFGQHIFTVTKATDPDPFLYPFDYDDNLCDPEMFGTLQWAVNKAIKNETDSRIEFNIPGSGPHEIKLNSYLPQIYGVSVIIDATTQPGYYDSSPAIILNGQNKIASGFDIYNSTVAIKGFKITNFNNNGILLYNSGNSEIENCVFTSITNTIDSKTAAIGISIKGSDNVGLYGNDIQVKLEITSSLTKTYGVFVDKSYYCTIGGVEEGEANLIANCSYIGIAVRGCDYNKISGNIFYYNEKAIEMIYDANEGIQPPIINDYTGGILSGTALPNSIIEIFGSTGAENANEYLISAVADENGEWSIEANTAYDYFVTTQRDENNNTSTLGTIFAAPDASIDPVHVLCDNVDSIFLNAATDGGVWSGNGIVDSNTGEFDPVIAGDGKHIITYTLTEPYTISDEIIITVLPCNTNNGNNNNTPNGHGKILRKVEQTVVCSNVFAVPTGTDLNELTNYDFTKMMSIDKITEKKIVIDDSQMMYVTLNFPQRERWKNDYEFMVAKMEMDIFGSKLYDSNGNLIHENTDYNSVDEDFYIEDEAKINEFGLCTIFNDGINSLHNELVSLGFTVCILEDNKLSAINDSLEYYFDFNKLIFETRIFENNLLVISDWKQYQKIDGYIIPATYVLTTYDEIGRNNNIRLQKSEVTSFLDYTVRNGTGKPLVSYKSNSSNRTAEADDNEDIDLSQYNEIEKKTAKLSAYPNPASTNINIALPYIAEERINIQIFNSHGILIDSRQNLESGTCFNLDISDYKPGLYLVKAGKGIMWQTTRFTKQ